MSSIEPEGIALHPADRLGIRRLEDLVDRAALRLADEAERARAATVQLQELEGLVKKFETGVEDPKTLVTRIKALEAENRELRERLQRGQESVKGVLAKIRFLEEGRS